MQQVGFHFKSIANWDDDSKLRNMFNIFATDGDGFYPKKFGCGEPYRHTFDPTNTDTAIALLRTGNDLFMTHMGKGAFSCVQLAHPPGTDFSTLWGYINTTHFKQPGAVERYLHLLKMLYAWAQPAYAYAAHEVEEDYQFMGEPSSEFAWESSRCLRGLFWCNFFGLAFVDFFGEHAFADLPAYALERMPDGGYLVLTAPSPLDWQHPGVQERAEAIKQRLNPEAFYDRHHPNRACVTPDFAFLPVTTPLSIDPIPLVFPDADTFITQVVDYAERLRCRAPRVRFDYSLESLRALDRYLLRLHHTYGSDPEADPATIEILREATAYYGETVRRFSPDDWLIWDTIKGEHGQVENIVLRFPDSRATPTPSQLELVTEYPFNVIYKRWVEGPRSMGAYRRHA